MNASKCFQLIARKYYLAYRHVYFARYIYCKPLIRPLARLSPTRSLSVKPSVCVSCHVHPSISTFKHYSSEPSTAEECSTVHSSVTPLKFEELTFEPPVKHEELMAALQKCKSLSEQMETLSSVMALTPKDIENRKKFCKTLESLFKPFFNDVKIQMFGSSVNHFGFKGCDIDMTFETSGDPSQEPDEKVPYFERPDVPLVSEVLSGKVSPQEISQLPSKEQLIFMHTVLLEYYKESSEPSIFINAYVPLVRFHHDKFNLKCDLTIKNEVAYANTKLLYFYAKLDERVVPLIMTLRYWAKHVELIGKGLMFNTYTITLLVIHFLQTRNPPVLPSAESILSLSDSFNTEDMDDTSFLNLIESMPQSKNSQPIDELLREFFFYFLYFDFSRVIVPLTGNSIPRKEFIPMKHPKFILNTISIQDPLCLSHNVAELVEFKVAKKLYSEFVTICKIYQENDVPAPSSNAWGLMTILDTPDNYNAMNIDFRKTVSFTLPYVINKCIDDGLSLQSRGSVTAKLLLKLVTHVLFFECSFLEDDKVIELLQQQDRMLASRKKQLEFSAKVASPKHKKVGKKKRYLETEIEKIEKLSSEGMVEQFQKVNQENEMILCCLCKISKNVWTGRDLVVLNSENLPAELINILNVQDPLSTFNNTASLLDVITFKKLYSEFVVTCKMFQDNNIFTPSTEPWGYMAFLHKPKKYDYKKMDILKPVSFYLPILTSENTDLKTQASVTAETVLKVLEHSLLFECSHLEMKDIISTLETQDKLIEAKKRDLLSSKSLQEEYSKIRKKKQTQKNFEIDIENLSATSMVEQFEKLNTENKLILGYKCRLSKDVCKGRDLIKLNPSNTPSDILYQEHLISKEIAEQSGHSSDDKKKSYVYLLECYVPSSNPEALMLVNLRPLPEKVVGDYGYRMQCIRLGIFLKDYIPKIMENIKV
ncbi:hypothetical protein JTE90_002725 [Oedothorax gibbosus]|uniref:Poly(A) RNA polymerase mitochondrial-like central palm domain-containing protein n=1 Tax=Oedothorax gibbosus TaxID=931172 RepID=A0AAV6VYC2_9ARAC|nr:hypothetical protein JTE90_002725 [Oedothorax gibbosus]